MLRKKHVLVLGAGASVPFDFPTGADLTRIVVETLAPHLQGRIALRDKCKFSEGDINEFRNALLYSGKNSVDAFLEHRTEFMEIGKAATAFVLNALESPTKIFRYPDNWLRCLYAGLNSSFDEIGDNKLTIVTFNYDRCVEWFLHTAVKNTYDKTDAEVQSALERIPIIHLHGRLGYLPWDGKEPDQTREFSQEESEDAIRAGIKNIKIIHEDTADRDQDFIRAKRALNEAERIIFMGFGYNQTNMERLDLHNLRKKLFGTNIGMGNSEEIRAREFTNDNLNFISGDCVRVMREHMLWE